MPIPDFRPDGYLPDGIWPCSAPDAIFRFGSPSKRRRHLAIRLRRWIELGQAVGASRLLLDGSFVTATPAPRDLDAVIALPPRFTALVESGLEAALEIEQMILSRRPEELFGAEDEADYQAWRNFFAQTRESDGRQKGLVEVSL